MRESGEREREGGGKYVNKERETEKEGKIDKWIDLRRISRASGEREGRGERERGRERDSLKERLL